MTIHEIIRDYSQKIKRGEIEYSQVREQLQYKDLNEEEIKSTLRLIDSKIQRELLAEKEKKKGRNDFLIGLVLLLIGLAVSGLSMMGYLGNGRVIIVTLGLIAYGSLKTFQGAFKMKK